MGQIQGVAMEPPLVLAGFSAGAALALELTGSNLDPDGLVLIAPFIEDLDDFRAALEAIEIPLLLAYGSNDQDAGLYQELGDAVTDVIVIDGVGHSLPSDLGMVLERVSGSLDA